MKNQSRSQLFRLLAVTMALQSFIAFSAEDAAPVAPLEAGWEAQIWESCPKALDGSATKISTAIKQLLAKKNLAAATEVAENYATFGSTIDVHILAPVVDALEKSLNKILSGKIQTQMEKMQGHCWDGVEGHGTLAKSAAAHCNLKVLRAFESAYGPHDY